MKALGREQRKAMLFRRDWFRSPAAALGVLMLMMTCAAAQNAGEKTEVWMGGCALPLSQPKPGASSTPRTDSLQMFDPDAPWQRTAEGVQS